MEWLRKLGKLLWYAFIFFGTMAVCYYYIVPKYGVEVLPKIVIVGIILVFIILIWNLYGMGAFNKEPFMNPRRPDGTKKTWAEAEKEWNDYMTREGKVYQRQLEKKWAAEKAAEEAKKNNTKIDLKKK